MTKTQTSPSSKKSATRKTSAPKAGVRPPLADRVFALLEGAWMIEREIRPKGRFKGRFSGTASFVWGDATILLYAEEGTLVLNDGHSMLGERRHAYLLHEDRIEVLFADSPNDGQHFIDILFPADPEVDWPLCSGDTYVYLRDTMWEIHSATIQPRHRIRAAPITDRP